MTTSQRHWWTIRQKHGPHPVHCWPTWSLRAYAPSLPHHDHPQAPQALVHVTSQQQMPPPQREPHVLSSLHTSVPPRHTHDSRHQLESLRLAHPQNLLRLVIHRPDTKHPHYTAPWSRYLKSLQFTTLLCNTHLPTTTHCPILWSLFIPNSRRYLPSTYVASLN